MAKKDEDSEPAASGQDSAAGLGGEARSAIRDHASPEGIVTILFTDIVASTAFRQRLGDSASQVLWMTHCAIYRYSYEGAGRVSKSEFSVGVQFAQQLFCIFSRQMF